MILQSVKEKRASVRKSLSKMPREADSLALFSYICVNVSEIFVSRDVDGEHNIKHV